MKKIPKTKIETLDMPIQIKTIKKTNVSEITLKEVDVEEQKKYQEKVKTYPKRKICGDCFYNGFCNLNAKTCMFNQPLEQKEEE